MALDVGVALAAIGAGAAIGLAGIGSGIGVGITGAAGAGAVAEDPSKFGTSIVFQALPQTQAIYGLLTAILILMGVGLLGGGEPQASVTTGLAALGAGVAVGIAGLSAIGQGISAASGVGAAVSNSDMFGRGMVYSVLPETQAIYGLLVAILLMISSPILGSTELGIPAGLTALGCGLAIGIAGLSAIGQGIAAGSGIGATTEKPEMFGRGMVYSVLPETQAIYGLLVAILLMVGTGILGGDARALPDSVGIVSIGCGLAIGIAGLSAIGQGMAAGSGIGATASKPEMFGRGMVFSVLPETQAIYGLLVAILLMIGVGILGGGGVVDDIGLVHGLTAIGCGAAIGLAGLSAIGQGIAAAAGVGGTAEKPEILGRGMVFSVLPETQAIYGLLVAILMMIGVGILGDPAKGLGLGTEVGLASIGAGAAIGFAGLSGIGQGITAAGGISAAVRDSTTMGKSLVLAVMSETFAIFGLLIAILIMYGIGFFG
ncbi:MAG: V-type ATP synthase subunit K [Halobacteriota archaeon]|nr:V-type ATP synthase subunit K [Halobacteriota archaeon]